MSKKPKLTKFNSFRTDFLTPNTKEAFIHLQKAFIKAPILRHFDPDYYIQNKTNTLEYTINRVLSQLMSETGLAGQMTHKSNN